jgi:hypothetical protein
MTQGQFQAKVDGTKHEFDAQSETNESPALLFSWNVEPGVHQLRLKANNIDTETSERKPTFDIDSAIVTAGDGDSS